MYSSCVVQAAIRPERISSATRKSVSISACFQSERGGLIRVAGCKYRYFLPNSSLSCELKAVLCGDGALPHRVVY
jgi:hypothetical protein